MQTGLDPASRLALARFLRRLCLPAALTLWPCLTGAWTMTQLAGAWSVWLLASAAVCAGVATWSGERPGAASLNHWDEFLACVALSRLAACVTGF